MKNLKEKFEVVSVNKYHKEYIYTYTKLKTPLKSSDKYKVFCHKLEVLDD
jgi:hypothetical protein